MIWGFMGKPDDKPDKPDIEEMIRVIANHDPEKVFKMAREHMKKVLGTDLELWDAGDTFHVKWTDTGVSIWASAADIIQLLRETNERGCDGIYHIALFDDRPGDRTKN